MTVVVDIIRVKTAGQYSAMAGLVMEYVQSLPFQLTFQDYQAEIAALSQTYGPPAGKAFLAFDADEVIGCVGVRRLEDRIAELKRLYVRPAGRGSGAGRGLTVAAVDAARSMGYEKIRLDTIGEMKVALALYA